MEKIDQILESLFDRVIEPVEAKEQLSTLQNHQLHKHITNNWLSFPENKPNQYAWVLVTVKSPIDKWVEMAGFDGEKFQLPGRGDTTFVTHWMPIPTPACC